MNGRRVPFFPFRPTSTEKIDMSESTLKKINNMNKTSKVPIIAKND